MQSYIVRSDHVICFSAVCSTRKQNWKALCPSKHANLADKWILLSMLEKWISSSKIHKNETIPTAQFLYTLKIIHISNPQKIPHKTKIKENPFCFTIISSPKQPKFSSQNSNIKNNTTTTKCNQINKTIPNKSKLKENPFLSKDS